jgi:RimJ/RimL family protein N-acetyltransferase
MMNPELQHWLWRQEHQERIGEAAGRRLAAEAHAGRVASRRSAAGGRVQLAQLQPSDGERLRRLFYRLSRQSLYRRFMSPIARPEQARPDRLLDVDHRDREAIVALDAGEIVGVARYTREGGSDAAELAVVVADAWQRQGVATRMLGELAERAVAAGIQRFTMMMLADNRPIIELLRRAEPSVRFALCSGVCETSLPVSAFTRLAAAPAHLGSSKRTEPSAWKTSPGLWATSQRKPTGSAK